MPMGDDLKAWLVQLGFVLGFFWGDLRNKGQEAKRK